ncbi:helix-turn-helix transcriptional regulator [Sinosporangium siamense]|uniref:AraC family transcriptional regulator n=1 Tax=Sinosporangium siamense TaxID=1367973 RepID=A0A919RP42_9ACTN|nr:helix-turn-helix transcriptional regulator [Sinosporangium siamense]GII97345.1 AraC family transcriptional regulator [Sinosporangium siamense]
MYAEHAPTSDLADRVACFWRQVGEDDGAQLVVPDGCVDLIWGPEGPFVAGPDTGPVATKMTIGDTFTGLRFKPGAVGDLFGVPLSDLRDRRVPVADLTVFRVPEAPPAGHLRALRSAVGTRIRETPPPDTAAPAIVAALVAGHSVAGVAADLGLSERQLHRRSVAGFGYAPKTLQRVVRFQHALRLARAGTPFAEVAITAGYADQAHLSHDVKRLSGATLSRLL